MTRLKRLSQIIGCISLAAVASPKLFAAVEEVIVTAQKQEENIQNVPVSITAMTSSELSNRGITSFEGIARNSPSITFTPFPTSSNTLVLYIRGQGISDPGQIASDGAVGLYQDGFYIARPQASTFDLADIERVEVLRGPQGTLYGRNTIGGAVNLISKTPTGEFGFKQDFSFGTRNYFRSLTSINLPKVGDLSTKFTILKSDRDGYVRNTGASHDFGEEYQRGGRFALRWDAMDDFYIDYFMDKGDLNSTPVYFQNPEWNGTVLFGDQPYFAREHSAMTSTYRPVDLNLSKSNFEGHGLTLTWDVNDNLTLKSLTGYRRLYYHAYQDFVESFGSAMNVEDHYSQHQFSQEFQFIGNVFDNRLNYILGLYYFEEAGFHQVAQRFPTFGTAYDLDRKVDADGKSRAIFGQATWTPPILDDRLNITLGARFTRDIKNAERVYFTGGVQDEFGAASGADNHQRFSRFNPALTADFRWTDEVSTYAKVTTGYKAGGSEESVQPGNFSQTYGPEELTNYEIGLKSYWFERTLRANISGFYSKLKDKQLSIAVDPENPSTSQVFNAGKLFVKGAEAELLFAPTDDWSLHLNYTFLSGAYTQVKAPKDTILDGAVNAGVPFMAGDNVKDLFTLPFLPKHSVDTGIDWTFLRLDSATFSANLNYRWQDNMFISASGGRDVPGREWGIIPAYGILNGRLTMAVDLPRGDKARISLWGKNMAHKNYVQYVNGSPGPIVPLLSPQEAYGFTNRWLAWNEPPAWGIDLTYEY